MSAFSSYGSYLGLFRQVNGRQLFALKGSEKPLTQLLYQFRTSSAPFSRLSVSQNGFNHSGRILKGLGITGVGLGLSLFWRSPIRCEPTPIATPPASTPQSGEQPESMPPPPESTVSLYELSFGTVAGICAGVFIKKGLKTVAFLLGGVFVLLQYLGSYSVIRVDWGAVGKRFEKLFYTTDATGQKKAPTVYTAWNWLVDFLAADFQPRVSFVAGLLLGLRLG
ncbi:hypothetical protein D9758_003238 [Tetrapyrgos nigripes]|uniref:FUN14 family protein n=1 Tax=Tetrapyrgos nigripes TaxID=182062 RepID=A0A8H5GIG1_9AGAR|nr:hypothetical protein D9758_003238 [Tetrapyrgos nigripes]